MPALTKDKYRVRQAQTSQDIAAAQAFRARCFGLDRSMDVDDLDAQSMHFMIEDTAHDRLVCCFRVLALDGATLSQSYAAQYYDLAALADFEGPMLELGRFCVAPGLRDPDILRLAWARLTEIVDQTDVRLLFGCSSFAGIEAEAYLDVFAMLRAKHMAPARWAPKIKAPEVFSYAAGGASHADGKPDMKKAVMQMPPLLRTYLLMGGWVSDHAVVDHQMNTLHVFTGLEIEAIPDSRKRLLRALV